MTWCGLGLTGRHDGTPLRMSAWSHTVDQHTITLSVIFQSCCLAGPMEAAMLAIALICIDLCVGVCLPTHGKMTTSQGEVSD